MLFCALDRSIRPMFPRGFRNETQVRHNFTIDSSMNLCLEAFPQISIPRVFAARRKPTVGRQRKRP